MPEPASVLFVCLHGSAKSVIAAEYFRRLAAVQARVVRAGSAGITPDAEIPPGVVAGLRNDGFDVGDLRPAPLTSASVRDANLIVSFGCDVATASDWPAIDVPVVRWDDVPAVSDGYDVARTEIVRRVGLLLESLF